MVTVHHFIWIQPQISQADILKFVSYQFIFKYYYSSLETHWQCQPVNQVGDSLSHPTIPILQSYLQLCRRPPAAASPSLCPHCWELSRSSPKPSFLTTFLCVTHKHPASLSLETQWPQNVIFTFLPTLQFQFLSLIFSPSADHPFSGAIFPFFFHSLQASEILLEDPLFLPLVDPISTICPSLSLYPIPIPMNQLPKPRNKLTQDSQCLQLVRTQKHSLQGKPQPPHTPKIQRGQQKSRNGKSTQ